MKLLAALGLALTLAACGSPSADPSSSATPSLSPTGSYTPVAQSELVPATCEQTGVLEKLKSEYGFQKVAYIPPPENYQPTPDLPIYPVLTNGGPVCVSANNEEQIGMYVFWTPDENGAIFDSQVEGWTSAGYTDAQIPGVSSDRHLVKIKEATDASPDQMVSLTFINNGMWIRIDVFWGPNAKFVGTIDALRPIIDTAIAAVN